MIPRSWKNFQTVNSKEGYSTLLMLKRQVNLSRLMVFGEATADRAVAKSDRHRSHSFFFSATCFASSSSREGKRAAVLDMSSRMPINISRSSLALEVLLSMTAIEDSASLARSFGAVQVASSCAADEKIGVTERGLLEGLERLRLST